jgi:hypothetical protein
VGMLAGLLPWIVYWALFGNAPLVVAGLAALVLAVASFTVGRVGNRPGKTLEIWAIGTFSVLTVLPLVSGEPLVGRWAQPLSILALLLAALTGTLTGKPLLREFAEADQPAQVVTSELFGPTTKVINSVWLAALAGMSVAAVIAPITLGDDTVVGGNTPVSYLLSWVVPLLLLGTAILTSRILTDRMVAEATSPHVVRKSTFVAFKELGIDELMYLAKEKADREAGAGMEAYAVQVGGRGIPLTGDESRESWPVTYKARQRA